MERVVKPTEEGIARAVECLRSGGIVAFPTESSYGLAALLSSAAALGRLADLKERPETEPFPVLVSSRAEAEALLGPLDGAAAELADSAWPGGLTLVRPPVNPQPDEVLSDLGMGVRISAHPAAQALARAAGAPVTGTSANRHGRPPAVSAEQVAEAFGEDVDLILDDGPSPGDPPSTVAVPRAWGFEVLREGAVPIPPELRITRDAILRERFTILQSQRGYRFSVDALLVAHFAAHLKPTAQKKKPVRAADLGTGCGVVALALRHWNPDLHVTGVELQPRLAALARLNVELNNVSRHVEVIEADLADLRALKGHMEMSTFDLVVSNPPYREVQSGRPSPDPERAAALSEQTLTLQEFAAAAAKLLKPGGQAALIYPAVRLPALTEALRQSGLAPTIVRPVHPKEALPARRLLVAAERTTRPRELAFEKPLVLHENSGEDTGELTAILGG